MESGGIADHQLSATSVYYTFWNEGWNPRIARLNREGIVDGWMPNHDDRKQYIEVSWGHCEIVVFIFIFSLPQSHIIYQQIIYSETFC